MEKNQRKNEENLEAIFIENPDEGNDDNLNVCVSNGNSKNNGGGEGVSCVEVEDEDDDNEDGDEGFGAIELDIFNKRVISLYEKVKYLFQLDKSSSEPLKLASEVHLWLSNLRKSKDMKLCLLQSRLRKFNLLLKADEENLLKTKRFIKFLITKHEKDLDKILTLFFAHKNKQFIADLTKPMLKNSSDEPPRTEMQR